MVTRSASIRHLDEDTVLVTVAEVATASEGEAELEQTLHEAEMHGKPALVIDLTAVGELDPELLQAVSDCQRRCLANGRWILVVPPCPPDRVVPRTD
jgi:hypothetical protein